MGEVTEIWTDYAIGAVAGVAIYHFLLRKQYPNTFPALNSTNMNNMNNIGINKVEQIPGIDLNALTVCRQNGLI
jgi:hypothetical protein